MNMDDSEYQRLLEKAEELGIINIDVDGTALPEALKAAVEATEELLLKMDKEYIAKLMPKNITLPPSGNTDDNTIKE
jgi:hypothetical protein